MIEEVISEMITMIEVISENFIIMAPSMGVQVNE